MAIANIGFFDSSKTSFFVDETQEKTIKNKKIEKILKNFMCVDFGVKSTNKIQKINELNKKYMQGAHSKNVLFNR